MKMAESLTDAQRNFIIKNYGLLMRLSTNRHEREMYSICEKVINLPACFFCNCGAENAK